MAPYGYRLRVRVEKGRISSDLDPDTPTFIERDLGEPIEIYMWHHGKSSEKLIDLVLDQEGLGTERSAEREANTAKRALMWAGLTHMIPIHFGDNRPKLSISNAWKDQHREQFGESLRPVVYGYEILDGAEKPYVWVGIEWTGSRPQVGLDIFKSSIEEALEMDWCKSEEHQPLAFAVELYMSAMMSPSAPTRLVDLVTVLEILSKREKRSEAALEFLGRTIAELDTQEGIIDGNEVKSLRQALTQLKTQSISQSVRQIGAGIESSKVKGLQLRNSKDGDLSKFFSDCYTARSELVHAGLVKSKLDVTYLSVQLETIVRHHLVQLIQDVTA